MSEGNISQHLSGLVSLLLSEIGKNHVILLLLYFDFSVMVLLHYLLALSQIII